MNPSSMNRGGEHGRGAAALLPRACRAFVAALAVLLLPSQAAPAARALATRVGVAWSRGDSCFFAIANPALPAGLPITVIEADTLARTWRLRVAARLAAQGSPENPVTVGDDSPTTLYLLERTASGSPLPSEGIGVTEFTGRVRRAASGVRADVDGNGRLEFLCECAGTEGLNYLVRTSPTGPVLWRGYRYLGYDLEPTCPDGRMGALVSPR